MQNLYDQEKEDNIFLLYRPTRGRISCFQIERMVTTP